MTARSIKDSRPEHYAMMLMAFCAGAHPRQIANEFGHKRSTIVSIASKNHWAEQKAAYIKRLERRAKSSLEKVQAANLEILAKMKAALWAEMSPDLEIGEDGKVKGGTSIPKEQRFQAMAAIMREEERILGADHGHGEGGGITVERAVIIADMSRPEKDAVKRKLLADLGMTDPAEE
jgi:hypothetical protein